MKKPWFVLILALSILLSAVVFAHAETAVPAEEKASWTVMFYICGSDLESKYSYASEDMLDIMACRYPYSMVSDIVRAYDSDADIEEHPMPGRVEAVIQTGGTKKWHIEDIGIDVDPRKLQRWQCKFAFDPAEGSCFELEQELPLQSMADPGTLSDFIRWSAENHPAEKYALVLWGHGGGSKTGIFTDELFDYGIMNLRELGDALRDGGVQLEALVFDACMMANLETACAVKDSAKWMIASEETVQGHGTNVEGWLQELLDYPAQDGEMLGRCICDVTQSWYGNTTDEQAKRTLTWSVIDLSAVDRLLKAINELFAAVRDAYLNYPRVLALYMDCLNNAEEFNNGEEGMRDIGSAFYDTNSALVIENGLRSRILQALADTVVYNVCGSGRSSSRGLSFCWAFGFTGDELDLYECNCPNPGYLAILDAMTDWTAPDWVYDYVERLPEMKNIEAYHPDVELRRRENGMPGCFVSAEQQEMISDVRYSLYQLDEEAGETYCLGKTACRAIVMDDGVLWSAIDPGHWWAVEGVPCTVQVVSVRNYEQVYNIPVRIGTAVWYLRCGRSYRRYLSKDPTEKSSVSENRIYGIWEGYDDFGRAPDLNILPLSSMAGQDFCLLYPIDGSGTGANVKYAASETMSLYRALDIQEQALPAGTYYLEYEILDMVLRPEKLERVEVYWDGEDFHYPEGFTWEGTITLD